MTRVLRRADPTEGPPWTLDRLLAKLKELRKEAVEEGLKEGRHKQRDAHVHGFEIGQAFAYGTAIMHLQWVQQAQAKRKADEI